MEKGEDGKIARGIIVVSSSGGGEVKGERVVVPCTRLIIAAGAWSGRVFREVFPASRADIPVRSLAGHSVVFRSPRWSRELGEKGCHTVFTTSESSRRFLQGLEVVFTLPDLTRMLYRFPMSLGR